MTTQTIKVEVPEGMEIDKTTSHIVDENIYMIRLQKIQPRTIVLEEIIDHANIETTDLLINGVWCREVKETDEPKLSLSICECKGLFEGNQPAINKVKKFIKENS